MSDYYEKVGTHDSWRIFHIMAEFIEGFEALSQIGPAVTVFGSARLEESSHYYAQSKKIARLLAESGYAIITGGGPGLMKAANEGATEVGGKSIGLNIVLPHEQQPNSFINQLLTFRYFFSRKVMFVRYASAFICLPGGFGTMDELFEALMLIQCEKAVHFPVILFGTEYWSPLIDWLKDTMLHQGCISTDDLGIITLTDTPEEAVNIVRGAHTSKTYVLD